MDVIAAAISAGATDEDLTEARQLIRAMMDAPRPSH